jgi:hypothetical protein
VHLHFSHFHIQALFAVLFAKAHEFSDYYDS